METFKFVDSFSYENDGGVIVTQTVTEEVPKWIFDIIDTGKWYFGSYEKFERWLWKQNNLNTWKDIGNALEELRRERIDNMLIKMNLKSRYTKIVY